MTQMNYRQQQHEEEEELKVPMLPTVPSLGPNSRDNSPRRPLRSIARSKNDPKARARAARTTITTTWTKTTITMPWR